MVDVLWEEDAWKAFKLAFQYYKYNMGERAAKKFSGKMMKCVEHIAKNHFIGKIDEYLSSENQAIRVLIAHKKYRIIYFIENDIHCIALIQNCNEEKRLKNR